MTPKLSILKKFNEIIKNLKNIDRDFWIYNIAFLFLFLSQNNKTYILIFLLALPAFFFISKKDLMLSTAAVLFLTIPFEKGIREWVFDTSTTFYNNSDPSMYSFHFGFSPKIIFGLLLFLLFLVPKNKKYFKKIKIYKPQIFLLIFLAMASFSSLLIHPQITITSQGFIRLWLSTLIYFSALFFIIKSKTNLFNTFITSLVIFTVFIGSLQLINQKPLGLFIELTPSFLEEGYFTTDGVKQYRVPGFISHPVSFGSFLSILIPIFLGIVLYSKKFLPISSTLFQTVLLLLLIVISIGTNSRSVWINLFIITCLFYSYIKSNNYKIFDIYYSLPKYIKNLSVTFLFIIIVISLNFIITRFSSIDTLFDPNSSGTMRLDLIRKSITQIEKQPLFGVGLNNQMYLNQGAPVHNTIILFFTELGIPTTIFFVLFLLYSLFPIKTYFKQNPIIFGCWVGAITFLISSQFHPLFNFDPTFDFLMLILGYITYASKNT